MQSTQLQTKIDIGNYANLIIRIKSQIIAHLCVTEYKMIFFPSLRLVALEYRWQFNLG